MNVLKDLYRVGLDWEFFLSEVHGAVKPGDTMLDAGAGECKWRHHFPECKYIGLDYKVGDATWDFSDVTLEADLNKHIPMDDQSVDVIISIQVLEHLSEPQQALKEMYRVLKPGKSVFLTTPFAQEEHQTPYDFYRYTRYGLKYLGETAGFEVNYVKPMGGYFLLMRHMLTYMHYKPFYGGNQFAWWLTLPLRLTFRVLSVVVLPPLLSTLDRLDPDPVMTLGYMTRLTKPLMSS